jgi:hypothetical protein
MNRRGKERGDRLDSELKGFEEVLDLIHEDSLVGDTGKIATKGANPFELYNFLEKERDRLDKIDLFFREKLPNLEASSITQNLIKIQNARLKATTQELTSALMEMDSPLMKNLTLLFDKTYTASSKKE